MTRANKPGIQALRPHAILLAMFMGAVLIRFFIGMQASLTIRIMPDEPLYLNIARGLWTGEGVVFRGQAIEYSQLFYPLLLSPLFALPTSVNIFRAVQLVNTLAQCSAVFPAYALAMRITGDRSRAFCIAGLTLLLPDNVMSVLIMTESVSAPLVLCAFWLLHRALSNSEDWLSACGAMLAGFVLLDTKPAYLALCVFMIATFLILWHRGHARGRLRQLLAAITALALLTGMTLTARAALGLPQFWQSLYDQQLHALSWSGIGKILSSSILYAYFFPCACLVFPLLIPLVFGKRQLEPNRQLSNALFCTMGCIIIFIGYSIFIDEYTGQALSARIHLRYLAPYVPIVLSLALSPALEGQRMNGAMLASLAFVFAASLAITPWALQSDAVYSTDALMLSSITVALEGLDVKALFQLAILTLIPIGAWALLQNGWSQRMRRGMLIALTVFSILNNIAGYTYTRYFVQDQYTRDAVLANEAMAGESALAVVADGQYLWPAAGALDLHSRVDRPTVELADLVQNTGAGGYFSDFTTAAYWRARQGATVQAPAILCLEADLLWDLALNAAVSYSLTPDARYALISLDADKPWLHSALSGFNQRWVQPGACLTLFDEGLCGAEELTVRIQARAAEGQATLTLGYGGTEQSHTVGTEAQWHVFRIVPAANGLPITLDFSSDANVQISSYQIEAL